MPIRFDHWTLAAAAATAALAHDPSAERASGRGWSPGAATKPPPGIILATTTSTQDSGLLDSLVPVFTRRTGIQVKVIAVGTGAALEMAAHGNADAVLVHAPAAERRYVVAGDLVEGRLIMHNDFLIVGPREDPAKVAGIGGVIEAMRAIARSSPFVSRGDGSGTDQMEQALWAAAGIDPRDVARREQTGQGMGATLTVADQRRAYTLVDRATYLAFKSRIALVPLVQGDARLLNVYHAYVVNPARHPATKVREAKAFVRFLAAADVQRTIANFGTGRFGEALFFADAGKREPALVTP